MTEHEYTGLVFSHEGGDGSGKGTQSRLMLDALNGLGMPTRFESFPRYHTPTGRKVAAYLNNEFGDVNAHDASLFYSDDRLAFKDEMLDWLYQGGSWDLDRYVDSNKGHQGGKLATDEERLAFYTASDALEYGTNGMPVPDMTFLYRLPPELAQEYVQKKLASSRAYTDQKLDKHEADPMHLHHANESFALWAAQHPDRVQPIEAVDLSAYAMRSRDAIHHDVMAAARPLLIARGFLPERP